MVPPPPPANVASAVATQAAKAKVLAAAEAVDAAQAAANASDPTPVAPEGVAGGVATAPPPGASLTLSAKQTGVKVGGLKMGAGPKKGAGLAKAAGFTAAEEESPRMKPLIPIDYSEEEQAAVAAVAAPVPVGGAENASAGPVDPHADPAGAATPGAAALSKAEIKAIIDRVPTQRESLYALPIDWAVLEEAQTVDLKLRAFIAKKMVEYLGEDEPTLVEHILAKLRAQTSAADIEEHLAKVLDDDASVFVVKLWRMLVFEMYAAQELKQPR